MKLICIILRSILKFFGYEIKRENITHWESISRWQEKLKKRKNTTMTENRSKEEILEDHCHVIGSGDGLWNKYPLIYISILKAMEEHAQQQLTPSWVKASERLPEQNKRLNLKWMSEPNYGIYDSCGMFIVGELKEKYPIEEIEWLDEQPNQTP